MHVATGSVDELELAESADLARNRLVRVPVLIGRERLRVRMAKLTTSAGTPRVQVARAQYRNRMRFAARHFLDLMILQVLDHLRLGLIRAAVLVFRHALRVRVTQLTAATSTPRVEAAFLSQGHGVRITACNLNDLDALQELNKTRRRLVGITLDVGGKVTHGLQAELAAGTGAPRVHVALDVHGDRVAVAARNLVDALVTKPEYFEWVRLERVALAILGHSRDHLRGVAELTHLARAPCVQIALLNVVLLVVLLEEFELILALLRVQLHD